MWGSKLLLVKDAVTKPSLDANRNYLSDSGTVWHSTTSGEMMFLFLLNPTCPQIHISHLVWDSFIKNFWNFTIATSFKVEGFFSNRNHTEDTQWRIIWKKKSKFINNVLAEGIKHKPSKSSNFENTFYLIILPISVKLWKSSAWSSNFHS